MLKIGWFSTARGESSQRLLVAAQQAIESGELDARLAFVFCNREPGEDPETDKFFDQVRGYGVPLVCLSSARFRRERGLPVARSGEPLPEWRRDYDREIARLLQPYDFDIGLLAGYMLIFTEEIALRYPCLNLHPAAPGGPAGTWQSVIWNLIETKSKKSGVMMHLATPELDEGPVATYCTFSIRSLAFDTLWRQVEGQSVEDIQQREGEENTLFREIRRHGAERELPLVVATLKAFAGGKVRIEGGRVIDAQGEAIAGYDLTEEIDERVRAILPAGA
jgi:folate-dependent phosphoribosylglycinamide formyltransferase PurN